MNDQASTLRVIASNNSQGVLNEDYDQGLRGTVDSTMRCLAITGGKGGVGKSNLSVNLALELGFLGKRVTLLDADFGLANADLLCGVSPKFHLGHLIAGFKELDDIAIDLAENVKLLPGGSGIEELANISIDTHSYIFAKLQAMEKVTDFMLIDTAAGIADNVIGVLLSAAEVVVVATPEPTSIVDAYATIKTLLKHSPTKRIAIVVNNVVGVGDAEQVFQQINYAVKCFLKHEIEFLGMVPSDPLLVEAVREQTPIVTYAPTSPASRAIRLIARNIANPKTGEGGIEQKARSFWNALLLN